MSDKIEAGNLTRRGAGRPKGSVNKVTASAKAMIEECAAGLGGSARMIAWAKEAPENERAFWSTVFPKLMPVQVNGPGENGEHLHKVSADEAFARLAGRLASAATGTAGGTDGAE